MQRKHLVPFLHELAETAATALFRYEELRTAAARWQVLDAETDRLLESGSQESDGDDFVAALQGSQREQLLMFEALEAFLAAWARVSLLLFPTQGSKERGEALRLALELKHEKVLDDRELRDSWMHFDERLDAAVARGRWGNRHKWVLSTVANVAVKQALRLFEVDTLVIHFRGRKGETLRRDLRSCEIALREIMANRPGALSRVPLGEPRAPAG